MYDLEQVAYALANRDLNEPSPSPDFTVGDEDIWTKMTITVLPDKNGKILRTIMVNDYFDTDPYRTLIDINLTLEEASEFAEELKLWLKDSKYTFVWHSY